MTAEDLYPKQITLAPEEEKITIKMTDGLEITTYGRGPVYVNNKVVEDDGTLDTIRQTVNRIKITETQDFDYPNYASWMKRYLSELRSFAMKHI